MNKWERREGKLERRSQLKFKQSDDIESYEARASAKKISKLKKRRAQEIKELMDIDDNMD